MRPDPIPVGVVAGVALLSLLAPATRAQVVGVTDATSTFQTFNGVSGSVMTDPRWDQQTGQGADDFVGDGVGGYYGFYFKYGQINGVDSMLFRFRFNTLTTQQGTPSFTGNPRLGVDGDGDGDVDLYFGLATTQAQQPEIVFQNPDANATNLSPNTSGLGTMYGQVAGTASNYNYAGVDDGSAYAANKVNTPTPDAMLTFAVPFSTFKTNLESQLTGVTITVDSFLRFVAFTSTQGNAVNQDVYGIGDLATFGDIRYDQGGGFSDFYSSSGQRLPEWSTWFQLGAMLGAAGLFRAWSRRKNREQSGRLTVAAAGPVNPL